MLPIETIFKKLTLSRLYLIIWLNTFLEFTRLIISFASIPFPIRIVLTYFGLKNVDSSAYWTTKSDNKNGNGPKKYVIALINLICKLILGFKSSSLR